MDLYDLLACPTCKVSVLRDGETLTCPQCHRTYPIVDGTPVLLPDGSVPSTVYQHNLLTRPTYDPWVHRVAMQSLPASAIMVDIGAGNLTLDLPNIIRMDVTLTPYVDVVGDAHAMPFLPGALDFIFSLAVVEHLRQPFDAARQMFDALRNGGYLYGDCNFVFAYHGYPHHYFNASEQGLQQVFGIFEKFRTGVAPYQLPSAALRMVLHTYLQSMGSSDDREVLDFRSLIQEVLDQPLGTFDAAFTERAALNVAAGTFFFGRKALPGPTQVIPGVVQQAWEKTPELKSRFPRLFDLGTVPNIMLWAKGEGREQFPAIDDYFRKVVPFRKRANMDDAGQKEFEAYPVIPPDYITIPDPRPPRASEGRETALREQLARVLLENDRLEAAAGQQHTYIGQLISYIDEKQAYIRQLESTIKERDARVAALQTNPAKRILARLRRMSGSHRRKYPSSPS